MEQRFIQHNHTKRLVLFFAGWGMDEGLFDNPLHPDWDYLICFDYTDPTFDGKMLDEYEEIVLFAWSLGVYMAAFALGGLEITGRMTKIAINGTLFPKDDERGIPPSVFEQTLHHFSEASLLKFRRRICGGNGALQTFLQHPLYRSQKSLYQELEALNRRFNDYPTCPFEWDKAVIGTKDAIFVEQNQRNAWINTPIHIEPMAHYDERFFRQLFRQPFTI